jgi:hypothetical protein
VRLLHALAKTVASFDDPNLVSHAGLVPVMALAERAGLGELVAEHVRPGGDCGVNAHLPSGHFAANAAWLPIAAMACNLVRAAGSLASLHYAKARGATIRRDLIAVAARTARHGRGHLVLHLPEGWHREQEWMNLWDAACGPPAAAA